MYLKRGETVEFEVELNWNRSGITKDWSVTAWGESGPVSVKHSEGIRSDHLPFTPKQGSRALEKYYPEPEPVSYEPAVSSKPARRQEPAVRESDGFGSY